MGLAWSSPFRPAAGLSSMIGEIGGSAEWAVAPSPRMARRPGYRHRSHARAPSPGRTFSPQELWNERFHLYRGRAYPSPGRPLRAEAPFVHPSTGLMERPFAGRSERLLRHLRHSYFLAPARGVTVDREKGLFTTNHAHDQLPGNVEHWQMTFKARDVVRGGGQPDESTQIRTPGPRTTEKPKKQVRAMRTIRWKRFPAQVFLCERVLSCHHPHRRQRMVVLEKTWRRSSPGRRSVNTTAESS